MYRIPRKTAVVTMIAVILHCCLPALAATGATIEGTVQVPCDPSRVSEIVSIHVRPASGGSPATVAVEWSTGTFDVPGLTEGEYDLVAIGVDGKPLSPEPKRLLLREGLNKVTLSIEPPGCGEPDSDSDGVSDAVDKCPNSPPGTAVGTDGCASKGKKKPGKKYDPKDWHLTLMYFGVVGTIVLALDDDDETRASPFQPQTR